MIRFLGASTRGHADYGWLKTAYSFSFSNYYNPARMGFGALRVLNDDVIAGGYGFPDHPHDNMEIITIVTDGALQHGDSMGHGGVIKAGDVQVMSAGSGVHQSEFNASKTESASLFQLWIQPHTGNITPRYDQKSFGRQENKNTWNLVVSPEGRDESLAINQYAFITLGLWDQQTSYNLHTKSNGLFLLCIDGSATIAGYTLKKRDAIEVIDMSEIIITPHAGTQILVVEVPMGK